MTHVLAKRLFGSPTSCAVNQHLNCSRCPTELPSLMTDEGTGLDLSGGPQEVLDCLFKIPYSKLGFCLTSSTASIEIVHLCRTTQQIQNKLRPLEFSDVEALFSHCVTIGRLFLRFSSSG